MSLVPPPAPPRSPHADPHDRVDASPGMTWPTGRAEPSRPATESGDATPGRPGGSWGRRLVRGRPTDPAWVRPALLGLLAGTALLYLWGLGASGWANSFYSAAVQAGTKSWKAFFFGSSDASNFITVDKPPASLWVMEISARLFGLSSWSILAPQALEGVATVALLYATVRRWFSPAAALLAGAVLALTPVATLMFRFNNPDSLLVLLLVAAAYATVRAVESGRTRWLVAASVFIGLGFDTKMLQAFAVVPVCWVVYLVAGAPRLRRRLGQLAVASVALAASAGWWVVSVMAIPAGDRPYIGGSQDNSLWNLIFGYNGFGRLTGNEAGSVIGGGTGQAGAWGATGWTRMFSAEMGGQIAWLIPAALLFGLAGLWWTRRAPRTDRTRAALLLWGGWLVVTGLMFSFAQGIIHPYYTVALAPAIAALVGIGAVACWRGRSHPLARTVMASALAATSILAWVLLDRSATWLPGLRSAVLVGGLITSAALLVAWDRMLSRAGARRLALGLAAVALVVGLAGPAAYSLQTASTTHSGSIPSAGPAVAGAGFGPGGGGTRGLGARAAGGAGGGFAPTGGQTGGFGGPAGGQAGVGSLLDAGTTSPALVNLLRSHASAYTWVAATVGSNSAAGLQLSSGDPVMAIGGFNGTDPTPTLAAFEADVAAGRIHYFVPGGTGGGSSSTATGTQITSWVESHFTKVTVGSTTVYDLTQPTTSS
jgi:4-amino-4-deoxy-L-arabinose transferase-like glycosyltransferase